MKKATFKVEGMSCSHCENAVKMALAAVAGVKTVAVSLEEKKVTVSADSSVTNEMLIAAIENQGYDVIQ